jgi:type II secretory pathway pseudopilin PulG
MIVVAIIAIIASITVPNLISGRLSANESAAIATLKNLAAAQAQCQAAQSIDLNSNGAGEFGYFAELAGGAGLRNTSGFAGSVRLSPPVLSSAFANVGTLGGVTGGIVARSGYIYQMYLPAADASGLPEADAGGVGSSAPNPKQSETLWCCYAWPSSYKASGRRVFFVNQGGDVYQTQNTRQRYSGDSRPPAFDAAFVKGTGNKMAATVAANASGQDNQLWLMVQ